MSTSDLSGGLLRSSVASASALMALQLFSRLFTFALNQALVRLSTPSTFGAASIQFEFILSTILFLSREGVRNALLRFGKDSSTDSTRRRTNLSFFPIFMGIPLAICTSLLYTQYASHEMKLQPFFKSTIVIYALAAVTELLSEPLYNLAMIELKTGIRVRAEGLGISGKTFVTFLVLYYDSAKGKGEYNLVAFACGQLMYSIVMLITYVAYLGGNHMRPNFSPSDKKYVDEYMLQLSFSMTLQSLVKHFLTEGDKLIISWFSPLHDQGGYALAVNYGSLIARIIFQPIEETLRLFFSRILGGVKKEKESEEQKNSLMQSATTLSSLLSVQISFSLIFIIFGSAYLPIFIPFLIPPKYLSTSAPHVLSAWIWYVPVLAVNGGLEAFLSSVATPKDLNLQSRWMVAFSLIYMTSAISLYHSGQGDSSLVYANIVNLSARIVYTLRFTARYFRRSQNFQLSSILPSKGLLLMSVLSALAIRFSEKHLDIVSPQNLSVFNISVLLHIGLGVLLGILCLLTWWTTLGRYLNFGLPRSKVE